MATKPVNAATYYKKNSAKEQEYIHVYKAMPVKEGDTITVNPAGFNIMTRADEDGYLVSDLNERAFLTSDELSQHFDLISPEAMLATKKLELPADITMKAIKEGQTMRVDAGLPVLAKAEHDGFLLTDTEGHNTYMSEYDLQSMFNMAGQKLSTQGVLVVTPKEPELVKGIVLDKSVAFAFKKGEYTAEAGSFLFKNAEDEDGYTVMPPEATLTQLRKKPASPATAPAPKGPKA